MTTACQFCVRIDDIEPTTLPTLSTRLSELNETLQPISYRVVVQAVRPEFAAAAVLGSIADLFRRGEEKAVDLGARMPFGRTVRDAAGAARLADLLTVAGCRCSIEIYLATPLPDQSVAVPATSAAWVHRVRCVSGLIVSAYTTARTRVGAVVAAGRPLVQALSELLIARCVRLRASATQAVAIGAVASLVLLLVTLPGTSGPVFATRASDVATSLGTNPLPPAVEWASRLAAASMNPLALAGSEALYRANTRLGEVSLKRNPYKAGHWDLTWNDAVIRELHVESPPSIVSRQGRGKSEPAIGEFGDEVALVIDTGEHRSMFCLANKPMLVVLSRIGTAHMYDIPGGCAELETAQIDPQRILIHFYDRARRHLCSVACQRARSAGESRSWANAASR